MYSYLHTCIRTYTCTYTYICSSRKVPRHLDMEAVHEVGEGDEGDFCVCTSTLTKYFCMIINTFINTYGNAYTYICSYIHMLVQTNQDIDVISEDEDAEDRAEREGIYLYIYIYMCVCVCVYVYIRVF